MSHRSAQQEEEIRALWALLVFRPGRGTPCRGTNTSNRAETDKGMSLGKCCRLQTAITCHWEADRVRGSAQATIWE